MAWLKVIISFLVVAMMEYSMRNEWEKDKTTQYVFEIAMSILCAGWIANQGW